MEIDEGFSAFEEVTEEMIREKEEQKAEAERLKRQSESQKRMRCYGIDFQGASLYFRQLKECMMKTNMASYNDAIVSLIEVISHEYSMNTGNQQL